MCEGGEERLRCVPKKSNSSHLYHHTTVFLLALPPFLRPSLPPFLPRNVPIRACMILSFRLDNMATGLSTVREIPLRAFHSSSSSSFHWL